MNVRMIKVDEFQFLTCLKQGLWASNKNIFKNWNIGEEKVRLSGAGKRI